MTSSEPRILEVAWGDGEVIDLHVLSGLEAAKRRGGRTLEDRWLLIFDAAWDRIIDARIGQTDLRVFAAIAQRATLDGKPWRIATDELAARVGINARRVRAATKALVEADLLRRPEAGWIEFNPDLMWRGSKKARVEKRAVQS